MAVQDACNLSGVVHSFSRVIRDLRENGVVDTDEIAVHNISVLFASKIASLTHLEQLEDSAFREVLRAQESRVPESLGMKGGAQ
ncbi:hypothetical protein IIA15_00355 [candidate division TA06 bacterium]|nr:hypothetical protein [candidate division TA06 bacterium]